MGSRKKAKGKKQSSKKVALLRTPFMAAFHSRFVYDRKKKKADDKILFPAKGQSAGAALKNLTETVDALGDGMANGPPAVVPSPTTFRDEVTNFLNARGWPDNSPVPPALKKKSRMVHFIEVAVILDRMLQALSKGRGGGGGGSSWPPHV